MTSGQMDGLKTPYWRYRAVGKTTAGGGGTLIFTITFAERGKVVFATGGQNDYSGAETIGGVWRDKNGNNIVRLLPTTTIDANTYPLIVAGAAPTVDEGIDFQQQAILVGKGDQFVFTTSVLAQNEELTIQFGVLTLGVSPPAVTLTGSGTETLTLLYDELI